MFSVHLNSLNDSLLLLLLLSAFVEVASFPNGNIY